jgi:hypothetical protein
MGDKPLTWQQVLIVLLGFVFAVASVMLFAPSVGDDVRHGAAAVAPTSAILIVLLYRWHVKANTRPDLEPDVLATLVDASDILQVGATHFAIVGNPDGRLSVFVQNLYDSRTAFGLRLLPTKGRDLLVAVVPALDVSVPPSTVVEFTLALPLKTVSTPSWLKLAIEATARTDGGRKVRFARRTAATRRVRGITTAAVALIGAVYGGGGTFLRVAVNPGAAPANRAPIWSTRVVYQPGPRSARAAANDRA